jgi:hypothetical protein
MIQFEKNSLWESQTTDEKSKFVWTVLCESTVTRAIIYLLYTIWDRGWSIITMKDNKTIEIVFLKNESRTMIILVSDLFLKANHKTWSLILGRSLPGNSETLTSHARTLQPRPLLNQQGVTHLGLLLWSHSINKKWSWLHGSPGDNCLSLIKLSSINNVQ